MSSKEINNNKTLKEADWEIDFYSRPIIELDGKKRWELLITSTQSFQNEETFKWTKKCPADEVNSIWLSNAFQEALLESREKGWEIPAKVRAWRSSMKTIIKKAADSVGLELIESRRTYSLFEWMAEREKNIYPNEPGYMSGPLAPPPTRILNQPVPLPEALRGDALNIASLSIGSLREAKDWPMEFSGLLPIDSLIEEKTSVAGLRLFSKERSLALSAWISGIEPVKLVIEKNQLLLEAGQDERWLVSDLELNYASEVRKSFQESKEKAQGLQFIAIQKTPSEEKFDGFWLLKDSIY